jgi:hypothetical protein
MMFNRIPFEKLPVDEECSRQDQFGHWRRYRKISGTEMRDVETEHKVMMESGDIVRVEVRPIG